MRSVMIAYTERAAIFELEAIATCVWSIPPKFTSSEILLLGMAPKLPHAITVPRIGIRLTTLAPIRKH
jgi:hypothetical protein